MADKKKTIKITGDTTEAQATIGELKQFSKGEFNKMSQNAEKNSKEVSAAFKKMGIRTEKDIKASTDAARRNYEKIKNSGTASANDIKRAHSIMTAKIKANNREMRRGASRLSSAYATAKSKIVGISLGVVGALFTVKEAFDFAESGAKLKVQRAAFNNFARSVGANADELLRKLKEVSRGTISEADLVASAGRALLLGLSPDKLVNLLEIARASSKITGDTVTKSFDDITLGVGRASKQILDNLGIILSAESAYQKHADALHKNVNELTDMEKRLAILNETARAGAVIVQGVGKDYDSQADALARQKASYQDLRDALAIFVLEALTPIEKALLRMRRSQLLLQRSIFEIFPLLAKASDFFGLTSNASATISDATNTLNKEISELEARLRRIVRAERELVTSTKNLTRETERQVTTAKNVTRETERQATTAKQKKQLLKEEKKLIEENLKTELDALDKRETAQRTVNATLKTAIQATRQELRNLKKDVEDAASFSESILREIENARRDVAQTGLNPVEKLQSNLKFGREDFKKATKEFERGNVDSARELTRSALRSATSVITANKKAFQEAGISPVGLDKAKENAEKLVTAIEKFGQEMVSAAQEKVPAVSTELEKLESQLRDGEATLDGLKTAIKKARDEAQELKDKLSENTTSTHTTVFREVQARNTGGSIQPIKARTGRHFPGYGGGDKIPILGEAGEFMMRKEAVRDLGLKAAHAFNNRDINGLISSLMNTQNIQKFAQGGEVRPTERVSVDLNMGGETFNMSATKTTSDKFLSGIKRMNIIHGRGKRAY